MFETSSTKLSQSSSSRSQTSGVGPPLSPSHDSEPATHCRTPGIHSPMVEPHESPTPGSMPSSTALSQSSSAPLQISGTGLQVQEPPRPSSTRLSQSSSRPLQLSVPGTPSGALHTVVWPLVAQTMLPASKHSPSS